ncbi:hypothetical protein D9M71_694390 [compost metagenome]
MLRQPGAALLERLGLQLGLAGQRGVQLLEFGADPRLFLLRFAQLALQRLVFGGQPGALLAELVDLLARARGFGLVLAGDGGEQSVAMVPGMLGAAAHRAGFAVLQLRAQCLDAGAARQALAFQ